MPTLTIPSDGYRLSALPKAADSYKHNQTAQAIEIHLPASVRLSQFEEQGDVKVLARLAGTNPHFELAGKKIPLDLQLYDNGFLYRLNEGADSLSLKARLDLRLPEKGSTGTDSEILKLMQGLASAQAEKRSAETADIGFVPEGKKRKIDPTAHRRGLFGAQQGSRSATGSPSLLPVPKISVTSEDPIRKAKQEALRTALIHLVAIRDVSKDYIVRTLSCAASDVEQLLHRHCTSALVPNKYKLNPKAFKLLDPYSFNYSDEDRKVVIDKTVEVFDRMRLGPEEKEWKRLLPKADRGKAICLSRLEIEKELVQADKQEKQAAREAKALLEEEHGLSRPPSAGSASSRQGNVKSSRPDWSAEMQGRKDAAAKVEEQSSRPKAPKVTEKLPNKPIKAIAAPSPAQKPAQVKAPAKRAAEKKSSQPPSSKIKSNEFITESDEEEVEAELKLSGTSPKPAITSTLPSSKEAAKPSKPSQSATKKVDSTPMTSRKTADYPVARSADKIHEKPVPVTTAAAVTPKLLASAPRTSLSRPSARPAPLDKQKLVAKATDISNTSSQPSTPKSATMPIGVPKKPLVTKRVPVPATASSTKSRTNAASGKVAPRETVKAPTKLSSAKGSAAPAKSAPATADIKAAATRDSSQKPTPKRDPNAPPKKVESNKLEPARKSLNGEIRLKATTPKPTAASSKASASASNVDRPRSTTAQRSPSRASEPIKAPNMQKTVSHQRKSSSPIKPSPLASSPPISASDIDEYRSSTKPSAASTPLKRPGGTLAQKGVTKVARREGPTSQPQKSSGESDRALKRKANDVDSSSTTHGAAAAGSFERPAKRRETGVPAPRSTGASGSNGNGKAVAAKGNNSLKAKQDVADRTDSHSPSPASSTIGSTSTKGTSMSMMSSAGSSKDFGKGKQATRGGNKNDERIKGFDRHDLDRAAKFEEEMETYNNLQREVALMGPKAPLDKIRDLHRRFTDLEFTKRTLAMIAKSNC